MSSDEEKVFNGDYLTENSENEDEANNVVNMCKIETQVYEVYKFLDKATYGTELLQHLSLSDIYDLMYPDYVPLF